jgi:Xaa-Pro aminopeptidase
MTNQAPLAELNSRMERFRARLTRDQPGWELAAIFGRVNQFYFTGTLQDGLLLIPRDSQATFWVRRSFERAQAESLFPDLRPMKSFRDAAPASAAARAVIHVDAEVATLAMLQRFRKYFPSRDLGSLDASAAWTRAVKSPWELALMERSGAIHRQALEEGIPTLLREGMSEAEFGCELFSLLVSQGHHGMSRFGMFGTEIVLGQIGFGENSVYPTCFDGPGGCLGLSPAAPVLGSRDRKLRRGDLVFTDVGCGFEGYHTDKTLICSFGRPQPDEVIQAHLRCLEVERQIASMLKPGAIPAEIYQAVTGSLTPEFQQNFMGCGPRRANFLGHGVGLQIDEPPVLAEGFDQPLVENMVLAVEPKKGIPGIGMVGSENTYLVTPQGGRSLTGGTTAMAVAG